MAIRDFTSQRLYVASPLTAGTAITLDDDQAHYLGNVLRIAPGQELLVFNGRDGEWRASVESIKKRAVILVAKEQTSPQTQSQDIDYLFAPLKRSRLDYMVQKATEMGVCRLRPVITHHTIAERVNIERMRSNAIEAAEQCGILSVPDVVEPQSLDAALTHWEQTRSLIFCDEAADDPNPMAVLATIKRGPLAVLIGPEGGFSASERELLMQRPFVKRIALGPRIMRADTAAVAALALINATLGDWR